MTDKEMISGLKKGQASAYEALYRNYFSMIRYLVTKNSGSEEDAGDIFQDGIVALFEKLRGGELKLTASLKTYIYSICRNLWLKRLRERGRMKFTDFEKTVEIAAEGPEEDPTEQQKALLKACMDQLGESCRKILERFYFFRMNMQEIADDLGYTNAANAKNQKYKCIRRLKQLAAERMKKG